MNQVTLTLSGALAEKYGRTHVLYGNSPADILRVMMVNHRSFAHDIAVMPDCYLLVDEKPRGAETVHAGIEHSMALVPVEEGAKQGWQTALVVAGVVLLAATGIGLAAGGFTYATGGFFGALAGSMVNMGIGFAISGLVAYSQRHDQNKVSDPAKQQLGSVFGGPVNTSKPGLPVPVGYGRLRIGSYVLVATLTPVDRPDLLAQGI